MPTYMCCACEHRTIYFEMSKAGRNSPHFIGVYLERFPPLDIYLKILTIPIEIIPADYTIDVLLLGNAL